MEKTIIVKMSHAQLLIMRDALHLSRLACDETDCYMCCEYGEMERRIVAALAALA